MTVSAASRIVPPTGDPQEPEEPEEPDMAYKIEKLARKIQKDIAEILRTEMNDPRMGFASITRVQLTKDLKYAKVFVSVLGEPSEQAKVMAGIEHARGFIQGQVARRLRTRQTPTLEFEQDHGIEESIKMSRLLRELAEERGETEDEDEDSDDAAEANRGEDASRSQDSPSPPGDLPATDS